MASQASSPGGLMYLWCHALPADVKGRLLQAPDAAFCVAGHVEVVVEVRRCWWAGHECAPAPALAPTTPPPEAITNTPRTPAPRPPQDCADGPALMLCFTVPPALARVHTAPHADTGIGSSEGRADPAQQEDKEGPQAALAAPCAFEPFSVTLEPRDADKWVQAAPSPMYRAINAPEVLAA